MNFFSDISNNLGRETNMNNLMMIPDFINNQTMGTFPYNNEILYKFNEIENRLKKLEQRITRLESDDGNNISYSEPDNSLYMI